MDYSKGFPSEKIIKKVLCKKIQSAGRIIEIVGSAV